MFIYTSELYPTANITFNKGRLKIHNRDQVFLKNGDSFEIELFNPLTVTILAKISLNGTEISQSGLVINPGQRVFLDRFIDVAKKFKFETYEVEDDNDQVKQAIVKNGLVEVKFYKEKKVTLSTSSNNWSSCTTLTSNDIVGAVYKSCPTYTTSLYNNSSFAYFNSNQKISKSIETGRVGKGESSNQKFTTVDKNFESYSFYSVNYKILPQSQLEIKDIQKINFCTSCGNKVGNENWKFCPKCGHEF